MQFCKDRRFEAYYASDGMGWEMGLKRSNNEFRCWKIPIPAKIIFIWKCTVLQWNHDITNRYITNLEKNIGRCGEVAVSGTSTVLATLNVQNLDTKNVDGPPASQPASRQGLDVLAGKTDSERHSEQSEAINLVPRSLVDENRRRCCSDMDTPAFRASPYPKLWWYGHPLLILP